MGNRAATCSDKQAASVVALAMRAFLFAFALFAALTIAHSPAAARVPSPALSINENVTHRNLAPVMQISQSVPDDAGLDEILSGAFDRQFQSASAPVPNLDGKKGPIWIRAAIRNDAARPLDTNVVFKFPQPQQIEFYAPNAAGVYDLREAGARGKTDPRMTGRFPNVPAHISPGETVEVLIRVESPGPILVPLQLYSRSAFTQSMMRDYLIFGLLAGCLLAIAIHAGLTFSATRAPSFGWFVVFALCGAGFIVSATGIGKALIWRDFAFNSNAVLLAFQGLANTAAAMFLASYLSTAQTAPRMHRIIMAIAAVSLVSSFSSFMPSTATNALLFVGVLLGPPILFGTTVLLAIRKVEGARTLLLGWTMTQAGTTWLYLRALDIVPYTEFNHYALPLAVTFTALQFSWALTSRARKAEYNATHDTLTGLPNRLKLRMLTGEASSFRSKVTAVLQVDLDGFKQVNDTLGHAAGDHALKAAARRISAAVEDYGQAFRTGGDEFVVLCDKRARPADLVSLANTLIAAISAPIGFRGQDLRVGASIGLAVPNSPREEIDAIIERADEALYGAKRAGKGRVNLCDLASERAILRDAVEQMAA